MGKSVKKKTRSSRKWTKKQKQIAGASILTIGVVALVGVLVFFAMAPSDDDTGWVQFVFVDGEKGTSLDGSVMLVYQNRTGTKYARFGETNPINTGETIYIDTACYAYIHSVSLLAGDTRTVLPTTIRPLCSHDPNAPQVNTIVVWFLLDKDNVSVDINELDGVAGDYNESDITPDVEHTITLNFTIAMRNTYSLYGHSSYVPDYALPALEAANDMQGFGLYLGFNGTSIVTTSAELNGVPTGAWYITASNYSIVQIGHIWGSSGSMEVTFEVKAAPTEIFIFQGFLANLATTKIQIT